MNDHPLTADAVAILADATRLASGRGVVAIDNAILTHTHRPEHCDGEHCWIHNPSPWPLKDAPLLAAGRTIYRRCTHAGLHPDVDDATFRHRDATRHDWSWTIALDEHPCCPELCCVGEPARREDKAEAKHIFTTLLEKNRAPSDGGAEILRRVVAERRETEEADNGR